MIRALDDFDAGEGIAERIAAARGSVEHVDGHAFGRHRVVGDIDAVAADQLIRAATADQGVVARSADQDIIAAAAGEDIGSGIAFEDVVGVGTRQVFDPGQDVALGVAAVRRARRKRDRYADRPEAVIGRIVACSTVEDVRAGPAG